ncbi:isochorismatase family protein [Massilia forsythiae]|uniref:Isochorismatase family protein n=1 Tax=Massilia forsythiae TaxID=2728020 RepID=A0A7Z2VUT6_9BURK|nr:isochorismatase family protein [Massilia forsythiae]QJD99519.1 isochorismatase family protein [Massilia forsythiae]
MSELNIDIGSTALVLIDLQNSNVRRELAPYTAEQVVGNAVLLAGEMRDRGGMVVYVRVLVDQLPALPADAPMPKAGNPPPDASQLAPEAQVQAQDIVVTKRQWGAFYGTELDQLLRRRHIKTIVLGGIATNYGVESTARAAFDLGYELVFAEDAMSSMQAEAHRFSCENSFRTMGRVRSTRALIDAFQAGTGDA